MTDIKTIRALTGLSQAAFAARFGIPRRTIEEWEAGRRTPPAYVIDLLRFRIEAEDNQAQQGGLNMDNVEFVGKIKIRDHATQIARPNADAYTYFPVYRVNGVDGVWYANNKFTAIADFSRDEHGYLAKPTRYGDRLLKETREALLSDLKERCRYSSWADTAPDYE